MSLNNDNDINNNHTYINLRENIIEAAVVIGRPAQSLEYSQPLTTQTPTQRCHLCAC